MAKTKYHVIQKTKTKSEFAIKINTVRDHILLLLMHAEMSCINISIQPCKCAY